MPEKPHIRDLGGISELPGVEPHAGRNRGDARHDESHEYSGERGRGATCRRHDASVRHVSAAYNARRQSNSIAA
jgi:hypothetical protein